MQSLLVVKGVWKTVQGTGVVDSDKDALALALLRLKVEPYLYPLLEDCPSAKAAWELLASQFESKLVPRKLQLDKELALLQMEPGESVTRYTARAKALQRQLTAAGGEVTPSQLVWRVLAGLPDKYSMTVAVLGGILSDKPILDDVIPRLLEAEQRMGTVRPDEQALFAGQSRGSQLGGRGSSESKSGAQGSSQGKPSGQGSKAGVKCFKCGKYGHYKRECPEQQAKRKQPRLPKSAGVSGSHQQQQQQQLESQFSAMALAAATGERAEQQSSPGAEVEVRWVVDSGATRHLTPHASLLHNKRVPTADITVRFGNKDEVRAAAVGDVHMRVAGGQPLVLKDVLLVPGAAESLLSLDQSTRKGAAFGFSKDGCQVYLGGQLVADAKREAGGLRRLTAWCSRAADSGGSSGSRSSYSLLAGAQEESAQLWHRRFCHLGYGNLARLQREGMVSGISVSAEELQQASVGVCEACVLGKQHRDPFPKSSSVSAKPLELLHMDLCGPLPESVGGRKYFLTVLDDFSKLSLVRPLQRKADAAAAVQLAVIALETRCGHKVSCVRSDNGLEFCNSELDSFLEGRGIQHQTSVRYSPQQNGAAERLNRTLVEKVRCMLAESGLPKDLWAEALMTANRVRNRGPVAGQDSTPYERFFGHKPDVSGLRVFGARAYVHVPKQLRGKLDPVSQPGRFVGYAVNSKGWRVLLDSGGIVQSRDVRFDEQLLSTPAGTARSRSSAIGAAEVSEPEGTETVGAAGGPAAQQGQQVELVQPGQPAVELVQPGQPAVQLVQPGAGQPAEAVVQPGAGQPAAAQVPAQQEPAAVRQRPARAASGRPAGAWRDSDFEWAGSSQRGASAHVASVKEPATLEEALGSPQAAQWQAAMEEEMASLHENGTWTLEQVPAGVVPIPTKWVYKVKRDAAGNVARYKARLVAKGCRQREGIDYEEVFAPVSKYSTVRAVLAVVAAEDLELHLLDFKTAFLNGELEEVVYTEQPPCYEQDSSGTACRLHKTIYGLKQAPRAWHQTLRAELEGLGFQQSQADPGLFIGQQGGSRVLLVTYVDDVLVAATSVAAVGAVKQQLMSRFEARDLGEATFFLGMSISRDRANRSIKLGQQRATVDLLEKYGMLEAKPQGVPLSASAKLSKAGEPLGRDSNSYGQLVGSLNYLAVCTRPDIAHAVGALARYVAQPTVEHWTAAKGVLRYLAGTQQLGLEFSAARAGLQAFVDADFAGDLDSRRSTTGYVFVLHGGAVSWSSKLQPTVAVSTTEAEFVAAAAAVKEALWLKKLLAELGESTVVEIGSDSQGAIKLLKNPVYSARTKHIDVVYHFARERVAGGEVSFVYVQSQHMVADAFTKAVPVGKLSFCCAAMGLQ